MTTGSASSTIRLESTPSRAQHRPASRRRRLHRTDGRPRPLSRGLPLRRRRAPRCAAAQSMSAGRSCPGGRESGPGASRWRRAPAWAPAAPPFAVASKEEFEVDSGFTGIWRARHWIAYGGWDEGWPNDQDFELAARIRSTRRADHVPAGDGAPATSRATASRALARQYWRYGFFRVEDLPAPSREHAAVACAAADARGDRRRRVCARAAGVAGRARSARALRPCGAGFHPEHGEDRHAARRRAVAARVRRDARAVRPRLPGRVRALGAAHPRADGSFWRQARRAAMIGG